MRKITRYMSAVLVAALAGAMVLTGCTKDDADSSIGSTIDDSKIDDDADEKDKGDASNADDSGNTVENTTGNDTDNAGNGSSVNVEGGKLGDYAEINAQYFVKTGDRVYFRGYGSDSFTNPVVFGNYLANCNGHESAIYYYDEITGDTVEAFADYGYGIMVFENGVFYLNGHKADGTGTYVYARDAIGNEVAMPKEYDGEIVDYQDGAIIIENHDYSSGTHSIVAYDCVGKTESMVITDSKYISYMGYFQGTIVYYESSNDGEQVYFYGRDFGSSSSISLGQAKLSQSEDICGYKSMYMSVAWFNYSMEGDYYFGIEYRSGTGNFYDCGLILKSSQVQNYTCSVFGTYNNNNYDTEHVPYIYINDADEATVIANEPNSFVTVQNTNSNYDLFYQDYDGEREYVLADFASAYTEDTEFITMILAEKSDFYGDEIFAMRVYQIHDTSADIGWRYGYRANKIEYVRIDRKTGKSEVILSVNHN